MAQTTLSRIGYGRVSTRDQNPDSQRDALLAAGCDPEHLFIDHGVTGKLARRPQWDACLAYLRPGDVLVVTRLSRAARSLRNLLEVVDQLRERGIDLVVLKQAIDTTTPAGRLAFHIMAAIDEFQRELIVEGTNEGLVAARARGRVGGRKSKLSPAQVALARQLYDATGDDGKRAHTVEEIGRMFGVTRTTVYRSLERDQANCQPAAAHSA
jgi:DNA invertase Pin-like site-specific DNA recombinase